MVVWQDPVVVAFCGFLYNQNAVFLLGLFGNHFVTRLDIEWSLITRKRRFTPVLIPYLFGRYSILTTLLFFVISNRFHHKISCDIAYKTLAVLGSSASYCSTLNLGIRSYIIWRDMNWLVVWLLSFACVGHAALVAVRTSDGSPDALLSVLIKLPHPAEGARSVTAAWSVDTGSCVVVHSSNITMFIFYLYTMLMDFTILVLTVCGLWRKRALQSDIGTTLSEQCLWYCAATFLVNIPAVVFPILNLNAVMNVIASMPATTVSVIMSSAAVLSLKPEQYAEPARSERPRRALMDIVARPRERRVTLTTNIVLESHIDSAQVDSGFERATSSKATEDADADAV
ncbi:hypothetical protein C8Q78DRAFT_138810 [Trametes maxima]|nr:hypothetical protein C8Q78DRAFT_138810 [Trametes maxima]